MSTARPPDKPLGRSPFAAAPPAPAPSGGQNYTKDFEDWWASDGQELHKALASATYTNGKNSGNKPPIPPGQLPPPRAYDKPRLRGDGGGMVESKDTGGKA